MTFKKGNIAWNKNLTKNSDERIRQMALMKVGKPGHAPKNPHKMFGDDNPTKRPEVREKLSNGSII